MLNKKYYVSKITWLFDTLLLQSPLMLGFLKIVAVQCCFHFRYRMFGQSKAKLSLGSGLVHANSKKKTWKYGIINKIIQINKGRSLKWENKRCSTEVSEESVSMIVFFAIPTLRPSFGSKWNFEEWSKAYLVYFSLISNT